MNARYNNFAMGGGKEVIESMLYVVAIVGAFAMRLSWALLVGFNAYLRSLLEGLSKIEALQEHHVEAVGESIAKLVGRTKVESWGVKPESKEGILAL